MAVRCAVLDARCSTTERIPWAVPFRAGDPHKIPIDPNGNLTTKTEGTDTWVYSWNALNQLTRVTKNSVEQARFAYDPLGRRVEKVAAGVTTAYTYDGLATLRQNEGALSLKYVNGPYVDDPLAVDRGTGLDYLHADGLGSVVSLTNATGVVTQARGYDAWGRPEAGADQSGYAFTGREWDAETGLYYYRARYYDPSIGRFLSEDPIGLAEYAYVGNHPTVFIDPLGLEEWVPNTNRTLPNCMGWGLGSTKWVQPPNPTDSPNIIPPAYGCTRIDCNNECPCDQAKIAVFEDTKQPTNWHVMRKRCKQRWTSKNGISYLWVDIDDEDYFYDRTYKPTGKVVKTCWCCPAKANTDKYGYP